MRILSPMFVAHSLRASAEYSPFPCRQNIQLHTHRRAGKTAMRSTVPAYFVTDELDGGPVILRAKVPVLPTTAKMISPHAYRLRNMIYPLVISWLQGGLKMR